MQIKIEIIFYVKMAALLLFTNAFISCNSTKNGTENTANSRTNNESEIPKPNRDPNPPAGYVPPKPETPLPNVGKDCVDLSKVKNRNEDCTFLWDPVCGCNNLTYENECLARKAGVQKWTKGKCNQ